MTKTMAMADAALALQTYKVQAKRLSQSFELNHTPKVLWPFVSQTDQINQWIGLQATQNYFEPNFLGGTSLRVDTKELIFPQSYWEWPYEWLAPEWLRVDRVFIKGFLRYLGFTSTLEKTAGGTRVTLELAYVPLLPDLIIKTVLSGKLAKLVEAYQAIDAKISSEADLAAEVFSHLTRANQQAIDQLNQRWSPLMPDSPIPALVAAYVLTIPDAYARRMRPFEFAARHHLDPFQTLRFFLLASKEGFLTLNWDLRCNSCQGAKVSTDHLQDVLNAAHCESCAMDYAVGFDQNLELTFAPALALRPTQEVLFCAGGPANTPQIVAQFNLEAGQKREIKLLLEPGDYRLRSLSMRDSVSFRVIPAGTIRNLTLELNDYFALAPFETAAPLSLLLQNPLDEGQTVKVENLNWNPYAVTASLVASLQEFRDLFHSEQLAAGLQLPVQEQVFLFVGLKQASSLFQDMGDQAAYALLQDYLQTLTQLVREYQGAVVKTMGDTLMAVFQNPGDALAVSLEAQTQFSDWNRLGIMPEKLQIGATFGPSLVTGSGTQTDYIGEVVKKAARLQRACPAGQILLDESLYADAEIAEFLSQSDIAVTTLQIEAPGADSEMAFCLNPDAASIGV